MKKLILVLFLFCLQTFSAYSQQNVIISGKLKMKPGTTIRFSHYNDNISLDRVRLSTVKTGIDSCFTTTFNLSSAELVNISVNELGLEALFYPNHHYSFDLASSQDEHVGNLIMITDDLSTNPQMILNKAYQVFSDSILSLLFKQNNQRAAKSDADRFNSAIDQTLKQIKDTFCINLIQSRRIDYLTMSRAVNFPSAFNQFLDCTNLPLSNPAFQSLLYSNFKMYFNLGPPQITRLNLFQGIPDSLHFSSLMKILSIDPALKCIPLRESVLLENLYSMIKDGILSPEKGISLFNEALVTATQPFNRQVAGNLINSINRQLAGTPIPDFSLLFPDGSSHLLSSLKGKPLHITFFTLKGIADRTLLDQISVVEHLADSLGLANFLCITTDANQEAVKKYWAEKKYPMQLCFAPDDYEIIDYFNAYAYPCFALLDSKGRIYTLAPSFPGDQLLKQLTSLSHSENPKEPEIKKQSIPQRQQNSQYLLGSPRLSSPPKASKK
jgi:hypothetical protein